MKRLKFLFAIMVLLSSMVAVQPAFAQDYVTTISNPSFETGNLDGWSVTGDAFVVTSDTNWGWGGDFNKEGTYHVWGAKNGDVKMGTLTSNHFTSDSNFNSKVSFLIGGGNDINNTYVALINASTGQELNRATGTNSEFYRRVVWDVPKDTSLYIKVVDNATGGWGHINVDDFKVTTNAAATELINPGFETGNLDGWSVTGNAFVVTNDTNWGWGGDFNKEGTYHIWGFKNGDDKTGTLTSNIFTSDSDANSKVSFLIGGGNDINNTYVALVNASTGEELNRATGMNSEFYRRVVWDVPKYTYVYIKIVDNATGGWGHINVDDFRNQTSDTIFDFEQGNLNGWSVVSGTAFSPGDVTSDSTYYGKISIWPYDYNWGEISFRKQGTFHLWGFKEGGDGDTGVLKSDTVMLGPGKVSFLIGGGGHDPKNLYVALVRASDGQELLNANPVQEYYYPYPKQYAYRNTETYSRVSWDTTAYIGEKVYIKVVDNATGSWGHINIDDVRIPSLK